MKYFPAGISFLILIMSSVSGCNNYKQGNINFPKGGYNFPEKINPKGTDFLFYPVKDSFTSNDSFYTAFYEKKIYDAFNEPNISLKPSDKIIFRFFYAPPCYMITLSKNEIIIKKGLDSFIVNRDESKLTAIENYHLNILESSYPISKKIKNCQPSQKRFLDSMIKIYPELLEEKYFNYLLEKGFPPLKNPYKYSITSIKLTDKEVEDIITGINTSGYWNFPVALACKYEDQATDGASFTLECNNGINYNIVRSGDCSESTAFSRACQKLIKYAGLDNEIKIDFSK